MLLSTIYWAVTESKLIKNMMLANEKNMLVTKIEELQPELKQEHESFKNLVGQLNEQFRNIKMLSKGTRDLDKILMIGRTNKRNWVLGIKDTQVM